MQILQGTPVFGNPLWTVVQGGTYNPGDIVQCTDGNGNYASFQAQFILTGILCGS